MKKNALRSTVVLMLAVACHGGNAQTPQQTILRCHGKQTSTGIEAPKDAYIPPPDDVQGTYTIQGSVLTESGDGVAAEGHYTLCRSTSTNYLFSTDCSDSRSAYIHDWLQTTDFGPDTSPFYKKHPSIYASLDTINIDRINLTVDEEILGTEVYSGKDFREKPFLVSYRFFGRCEIAKPKL